ncbi:MAG: SAM-dependent methyltransferase, partial [Bacteroidales bacterium]|nr:SAM-dependent methyltransferase [Bacteroidales bacterium]
MSNIESFSKRKSSIYKGKPLFSIFGIGDYSFKPYKVGISGMYKTTTFSLIKPNVDKPIMLDDTCYFVGFDTLIEAEITRFLLNKQETQNF